MLKRNGVDRRGNFGPKVSLTFEQELRTRNTNSLRFDILGVLIVVSRYALTVHSDIQTSKVYAIVLVDSRSMLQGRQMYYV